MRRRASLILFIAACGPSVSVPAGSAGGTSDSSAGVTSSGSSSPDEVSSSSTHDSGTLEASSTTSSTSSTSTGPHNECTCGPGPLELEWEAIYEQGFTTGFSDFGLMITPSGHTFALRRPLPARDERPVLLLHAAPDGALTTTDIPALLGVNPDDVRSFAATDERVAIGVENGAGLLDLRVLDEDGTPLCTVETGLEDPVLAGQTDGSWLALTATDVVRWTGCDAAPDQWLNVIGVDDPLRFVQMGGGQLWVSSLVENGEESVWRVRALDIGSNDPALEWTTPYPSLPGGTYAVAMSESHIAVASDSPNSPVRVTFLEKTSGRVENRDVDGLKGSFSSFSLLLLLQGDDAWVVSDRGEIGGFSVGAAGEGCCVFEWPSASDRPRSVARVASSLIFEAGGGPFHVHRYGP